MASVSRASQFQFNNKKKKKKPENKEEINDFQFNNIVAEVKKRVNNNQEMFANTMRILASPMKRPISNLDNFTSPSNLMDAKI